jgi:hypothetical protein
VGRLLIDYVHVIFTFVQKFSLEKFSRIPIISPMSTPPKLIAFDIYDTCLGIQHPNEAYKQLFRDLHIVDTQKQLKNTLITSSTPLEDIIAQLFPEALASDEQK